MRVVLTDQALADLTAIGDYIAADNPQRAVSFVAELRERAKQIGAMPMAFPIADRYARSGLRRRVSGNYIIFYLVEPDRVTVVHILHGARDITRILSEFE